MKADTMIMGLSVIILLLGGSKMTDTSLWGYAVLALGGAVLAQLVAWADRRVK